jgi:FG-GAP-like repeat/Putative Ig domain
MSKSSASAAPACFSHFTLNVSKLVLAAGVASLLALAFASSCSSSGSGAPISVQLSPSATKADQGQSVTITAMVTNSAALLGVSWNLTGPGLLTKQNSGSVTYATPTSGSGTQTATITATSIADATKTASVQITVNPEPFIVTGPVPEVTQGSAYSQMVTESGGTPPFVWSIPYGALPTGLSINSSTGVISGTPTEGGTWYFWIGLQDAAGITDVAATLNIEVLPNSAAGNPVPFLNQPLVPDAVAPGGQQFTLTANGTGFLSTSTIDFNGTALATTFVSSKQLTAVVPAADISTASTASITVVNPAPGGGKSNAVYLSVSTPQADVTFSSAKGSPISISLTNYATVGDFRGQGRPDLAIAQNGPFVYIMLANGDGTFTAATGSPVNIPRAPWNSLVNPLMAFLATGDFDNSGKLGLAVVNLGESAVPILLGNGDGTFTIPGSSVYGGGLYTNTLAVGDFIGNGNLDLAVANSPEGAIDVVLGCGDGSFNQAPTSAEPDSSYMPVVGDFNGDGKLDLAVSGGGYGSPLEVVTMLLGNGDGTFSLGKTFGTGANPWAIVAADFNGDGKLDLAITNVSANTVTVLLGNGDGTFTAAAGSPVTVGSGPYAIATGDFNSDGKLDLAVANQNDGSLTILLGKGDGTFTPSSSSPIAVGGAMYSIAVGDFNSSGRLGIAIATGSNVTVLVQAP